MESFVNAVNETPNTDDPITLHFVKQNIQINMGCNFNYFTKKARRNAKDPAEDIITDTRNLLPNVVDDLPQLSQKARSFWFDEFKAQGLIPKDANLDSPPSVSAPEKQKKKLSFFGKIRKYCMTFVTGRRKR